MKEKKNQLAILPLNKNQIELLIRTVAKGASIDELGMFFNIAKRAGLDPFTRQIHLVPRQTKQPDGSYQTVRMVQVGIDGFRAIAERTKQLAGIDDAIFDGGVVYEPGKEPSNPSKATVTVYRMVESNKVSFTATARWKEYFPGEKLGFMWKKMPYGQLSKCAEALALRKAFPMDLSGLYIDEEMEQAGVIEILGSENKGKEEPKKIEKVEPKKTEKQPEGFRCNGCDIDITKAIADFSTKIYGKPYCRECQKQYPKLK